MVNAKEDGERSVGQPIYDAFFSYYRDDSWEECKRLRDALMRLSPRVEIYKDDESRDDLLSGDLKTRLHETIKTCKCFVLVLGRHWSESQIREALQRERDWVRKEIETAQQHNRRIVLVSFGDFSLSTDFLAPLVSVNTFHSVPRFRADLSVEVRDLYRKITGQDPQSANTLGGATMSDHFAELDRTTEADAVQSAVRQGHRALVVTGESQDDPLVFAHRCARDLGKSTPDPVSALERHDGAGFVAPKQVPWMPFADLASNPQRRKPKLLELIGDAVQLPRASESDLRNYFADLKGVAVFWSSMSVPNRQSAELVAEWEVVWQGLLSGVRANRGIALLFVPRNLVGRPVLPATGVVSESLRSLRNPGLGLVHPAHVDEFLTMKCNPSLAEFKQASFAATLKHKLLRMAGVPRRFLPIRAELEPIVVASAMSSTQEY